MVYRVYVQKREQFSNEAQNLKNDIKEFLQIKNLNDLKIFNRYDVENIDQDIFEYVKKTIFSEPQVDEITEEIKNDSSYLFAVENLDGQFDQRADSAAQCIQIVSQKERPLVKTAKIYKLYGDLDENEIKQIKNYIINPVESKEATLEQYETLAIYSEETEKIKNITGFLMLDEEGLKDFLDQYALAMDLDDLKFCQSYFRDENREPTLTEIKIIDTYWSDHCRHTTFLTTIDKVRFEDELIQNTFEQYLKIRKDMDRKKPINLMDVATIMMKYLDFNKKLERLDKSKEINACTVEIDVDVDGKIEKWLLLFKNETHNHPTEIEPFGGAATCIGGAIRDPLSGRGYVYSAMRISGSANPLDPIDHTIKGKLSQRKIAQQSSDGYSSYGNQIGIATGIVDEIYHEGYMAKHLELGAVLGAVLKENVFREEPKASDKVILLGGKTGRDGCGGATGSSKSHNLDSLARCGAEVQKGNAPEERKIQRLFRNKHAIKLVKKCNDFGAGGVCVAVSELADGIEIDLDKIPKKYGGLNALELAISESQERMAVVVSKENAQKFIDLAYGENLEATVIAHITEEKRLVIKHNNENIANLSRKFLDSNGVEKHIDITISNQESYQKDKIENFTDAYKSLASDLNICSKKGLAQKFDSTIGAATVLLPFGGKYQETPIQAMVNKIPVENGETKTCSLMAWGYNPFIFEKNQFEGAYFAVVESVCKLIATGARFEDVYLTFQEYFEKLGKDSIKWGKPLAALLGAFLAQKELGICAIGGKDSMSGTFENINVPPTLVSFAVTTESLEKIVSPEFKKAGSKVVLLTPKLAQNSKTLLNIDSLKENFKLIEKLIEKGCVLSLYTTTYGGVAEAIMKMCFGNKIGFEFDENIDLDNIFKYSYGSFIIELDSDEKIGIELGKTTNAAEIVYKNETVDLDELLNSYSEKLEPVYKTKVKKQKEEKIELFSYEKNNVKISNRDSKLKKLSLISKTPKVLIPVFFGTNCEYDSAKVFKNAGAQTEIFVFNNLTPKDITNSIEKFTKALRESQILFIPGGFSGGDEPDGSAKFIASVFRNQLIKEEVSHLLEKRDGLISGICNGFQALIKLGLVPYGKILDLDENSPTLTYNTIKMHQSKLVRTRIASNKSPWLLQTEVGEIYTVPISHGEGCFVCEESFAKKLALNGQIATQYVDFDGMPTMDINFNPNGSTFAIEGITSPDGRVFGKMGHSERIGSGLYKNYDGKYDIKMFESAVNYFK